MQLDSWGLNSMADEVVAVVSELVTNAVQACSDGNPPRQLRFRMSLIGSRVRVEVWDPEPDPPEMLEDVEPDAGVGRGLRIVDTLTGGRWGSAAAPDVGGKVVWAELAPGHGD